MQVPLRRYESDLHFARDSMLAIIFDVSDEVQVVGMNRVIVVVDVEQVIIGRGNISLEQRITRHFFFQSPGSVEDHDR